MKPNRFRCNDYKLKARHCGDEKVYLHWENIAIAMMILNLFRFPGVDQSWKKVNFSLKSFSSFRACLICAISKTINGSCSPPPLAWYRARIFAACDSWKGSQTDQNKTTESKMPTKPLDTRKRGLSGTNLDIIKHWHTHLLQCNSPDKTNL